MGEVELGRGLASSGGSWAWMFHWIPFMRLRCSSGLNSSLLAFRLQSSNWEEKKLWYSPITPKWDTTPRRLCSLWSFSSLTCFDQQWNRKQCTPLSNYWPSKLAPHWDEWGNVLLSELLFQALYRARHITNSQLTSQWFCHNWGRKLIFLKWTLKFSRTR